MQFYRLLLRHDAYIVCISPGPENELAEIQRSIPFTSHPFVCDRDLVLAHKMQLNMSISEIWPAILHIKPDLAIFVVKIGRGPGNYGHETLFEYLEQQRWDLEKKGVNVVKDARQVIDKLRRQMKKWEGKNSGVDVGSDVTTRKDDLTSQSTDNQQTSSTPAPSSPHASTISTPVIIPSLNTFPPELLLQILSWLPSLTDFISCSRVNRTWHFVAYDVLVMRLRSRIARLTPLLPQRDGHVVQDAEDVTDATLERPEDGPECGIRVLEDRVTELAQLVEKLGAGSKRVHVGARVHMGARAHVGMGLGGRQIYGLIGSESL